MGGKSLGDRLMEAEMTMKQAGPAMKHGLEDMKAVKDRAEKEFDTEQGKLQGMVAGAFKPIQESAEKQSAKP